MNRALESNIHRDDTVTLSSATMAQATYNLHSDTNSSHTTPLQADLFPFIPSVSAD